MVPSDVALYRDGVVQVLDGLHGCHHPVYTPDGHLLVACDGQVLTTLAGPLYLATADGHLQAPYVRYGGPNDPLSHGADSGTVTTIDVTTTTGSVALSVQGQGAVGFVALAQQNGQGVTMLGHQPVNFHRAAFIPSSDDLVAFQCTGGCGIMMSGPGEGTSKLVRIDRSGSIVKQLVLLPDDSLVNGLSVSPDGLATAYSVEGADGSTVSIAAGDVTHVLTGGVEPAWQPVPANMQPAGHIPAAAPPATGAPPTEGGNCPLAGTLPVNVAIVGGGPWVTPSNPVPRETIDVAAVPITGDATDLVVSCNPDGPGYRVESPALWESVALGWDRHAARQWLSEHGAGADPQLDVWARCRSHPDESVRETDADPTCFSI